MNMRRHPLVARLVVLGLFMSAGGCRWGHPQERAPIRTTSTANESVSSPSKGASPDAASVVIKHLHADGPKDTFGCSICVVADQDGDGISELAIGDVGFDGYRGRVLVCSGRTGKLLREIVGPEPGQWFGYGIARLGDIDGDGVGDFAISAVPNFPWWHNEPLDAAINPGRVHVITGRSGREIRRHTGDEPGGRFGYSVSARRAADGRPDGEYWIADPGVVKNGRCPAAQLRAYRASDGAAIRSVQSPRALDVGDFDVQFVTATRDAAADASSNLYVICRDQVQNTCSLYLLDSQRISEVNAIDANQIVRSIADVGKGRILMGSVSRDGNAWTLYSAAPVKPIRTWTLLDGERSVGSASTAIGSDVAGDWDRFTLTLIPRDKRGAAMLAIVTTEPGSPRFEVVCDSGAEICVCEIDDLDGDGVHEVVMGCGSRMTNDSTGLVAVLSGKSGNVMYEISAGSGRW